MKRIATLCTALALAFVLAGSAVAQTPVTIREINDIPDENLQELIALGGSATIDEITELTEPTLLGEEVIFTAVVLTNPYNSGLASPNEDGIPGRVHMFVRDVTAADEGYEGMTVQVVDGTRSIEELQIGDVVTMVGDVTRFGLTIQLAPSAFEIIDEVDPDDPLLQPIVVSTDDIHNFIAEGDPFDRMQFNWENFEALNNQYVRLENAQVVNSIQADQGRPAYLISSPETETLLDSYDISLRYRNDRTETYASPPYNVRPVDDPFVPPPAGAFINLQGFLVATSSNFNYPGLGQPNGAIFSIAPFEDDDLEITETPPIFNEVSAPDFVPGDEDVTITADIVPDPERTIESATLHYEVSTGGGEQSVAMTNTSGDTYEATIPAADDEAFVSYYVEATDSEGATSTSSERSYRVLYDGITAIEHVQRTASGGPGNSPFTGLTTEMDIEAVVMSDPDASGFLMIQDDPDLEAWTGVFVEITLDIAGLGLVPGDRVTISEATIGENFNVTELQDATVTRTSGGEPYAYKVVPTGVLAQDAATAEAHEGMALRFEDVTVTHVNADGPDDEPGFGEFQISSDGSEANQIRVDDASDDFPTNWNLENLNNGAEIEFVQGLWWFSFGNYKLLPESTDDIGMITLDAEDDAVAGGFSLDAAYPNPFAGSTTLSFTTAEQGAVRLEVFDIVGRRVATLVDGPLAPATHTVTLDGRGLAGGTYVVRLQAGDRVTTQKIVLVK